MPKKLERLIKFCLQCNNELKLNNTRDIERKKFCSKSCCTKWNFSNNLNFANKNKLHSDKTKKLLSYIKIVKKAWQGKENPNFAGKINKGRKVSDKNKKLSSQRMLDGGAIKAKKSNTKISSLQVKIENLLTDLDISFVSEFAIHSRKLVDIFIAPNICIECDGDYWHSLPRQKQKDIEFNEFCEKNNYKLLRLTESYIKNNSIETIKERILCHLAN
jgi:very-short-patch-repair endonuclease